MKNYLNFFCKFRRKGKQEKNELLRYFTEQYNELICIASMPHNRGIRLSLSRIEEFVLNINQKLLTIFTKQTKDVLYNINVGI